MKSTRRIGLDFARIFASFCIIGFHNAPALALGSRLPIVGGVGHYITVYGYLAVDVFFVLSGWLLTRQALEGFDGRAGDRQFVTRFWVRRWFRTLPSYWIVVALVAVPLVVDPRQTLKHMAFLQTVALPNVYPVSWSLVAEEWFYLLLPVAILGLAWLNRPWAFIALWLGTLIVSATLRSIYVTTGLGWLFLLTLPQARLEGLLIGSLLAVLAVNRPGIFARLHEHRRALALVGALLAVGVLVAGDNDSWWFQVPGLVAFSLGVGATIPFLAAARAPVWLPVAVVGGVTFLSELTYPLYLLHPLIPHVERLRSVPIVYYGSGFVILLVVAIALHMLIEQPFLRLRDWLIRPHQKGVIATTYTARIVSEPSGEIGV